MIYIDGKNYKANWVSDSLTRTAEIINSDDSTRLQGNKTMYIGYVGTFYNYSGTLIRSKNCTDTEWDELWDCLTNPINSHTIRFPYNQRILQTKVYISKCEQTLKKSTTKNNWSETIEVEFIAIASQRLAGKKMSGLI